ncbi:MAG: DUF3141 domain-containing protein [Pseudomonadota bacterium]
MNVMNMPHIDWATFNPETPRSFSQGMAQQSEQQKMLKAAIERHYERNQHEYREAADDIAKQTQAAIEKFQKLTEPQDVAGAFLAYVRDSYERSVLFLDILRQRGDIFLEHEAAGAPPVLIYNYDVVVDGHDLPRPCNYILLRIKAPQGVETKEWKRPYVIIDPRAGHGPGIGGFKKDSQVGVALNDGHPVYFVAFKPMPVPSQTLADVTQAEAAFLREIRKLHPQSPKSIVVGNCQGGWATAILAATNPDLAGPIVLNGAPMSYWSGRLGQDPMRYTGGIVGGVLPAMVMSDLGGGIFDGAHLVQNFESLNPGRTWFRKYYDVYSSAHEDPSRFLEFEKWWGGFFLMNEPEIRWIVDNLFVGNKLGKNEARIETGRGIDLKAIRAPVIVFASYGDNITPPQQALNWIPDTYVDEREIEVLGQRIIYMVHEEVGHLGIFVSSSVAKKEHSQMASTLKTIEALPPGLYEMIIEDARGEGDERTFKVDFKKRTMADIALIDDERGEEPAFAAVSRLSENLAEAYETTARPLVQAMVPAPVAEAARKLHPMRTQRSMFASTNPMMGQIAETAGQLRHNHVPLSPDNPFVMMEKAAAANIEMSLNLWRDMRAVASEAMFIAMYANPLALWYGKPKAKSRTLKRPEELRTLDAVQAALDRISLGGTQEAIVRMLVLLANTRGDVRSDRLSRSSEVLNDNPLFAEIDPISRSRMIHEQTVIAQFEPEPALQTLPQLLPMTAERKKALELVEYIVGDVAEMEPHTFDLLNQMRDALSQPKLKPAKSQKKADA